MIFTPLQCNLHCPRCYQKSIHIEAKEQTDIYSFGAFIRRVAYLGLFFDTLIFTGGEPSLWPHLKLAILQAKTIAKKIRINTNAVNVTAETFEGTHILDISSYGGINVMDIIRLKKTFPGKVQVRKPVHLDWPFKDEVKEALPADCGCVQPTLLGKFVYPCAFAALLQQDCRVPIGEFSKQTWGWFNPRMQEICKGCLVNEKVRRKFGLGLLVECSIWESRVARFWSLNSNLTWYLRSLWRKAKF